MINTQPGKGAEQRAAFAKLAPLVRAEHGCLHYDLHPWSATPTVLS
nr:antibiotic biosynthesis monooxygenase [Pseudomonas sp. ADAK22]